MLTIPQPPTHPCGQDNKIDQRNSLLILQGDEIGNWALLHLLILVMGWVRSLAFR